MGTDGKEACLRVVCVPSPYLPRNLETTSLHVEQYYIGCQSCLPSVCCGPLTDENLKFYLAGSEGGMEMLH
jgi:hypothetical protein